MVLIVFIVIGWVSGLLARFILPGIRHMGLLSMALVGMVGGLVGGMFAGTFQPTGTLFIPRPLNVTGAFIGAFAAILLVFVLNRQRAHA